MRFLPQFKNNGLVDPNRKPKNDDDEFFTGYVRNRSDRRNAGQVRGQITPTRRHKAYRGSDNRPRVDVARRQAQRAARRIVSPPVAESTPFSSLEATCLATTSKGKPCKNKPAAGFVVCKIHGGTA